MSTTLIKLKKSSVAGKTPLTGDLDYGELALNYADGRLYYKNSSNAIKAFGDSAQTETLFDAKFDTKTTSDLTEGSNLYYTTARADSDAKNAISVTDAGGDGSLTYNAGTGVITYTGPSASEVRAHFTGGSNINISNGKISLDSAIDVPLNYIDLAATTPAYSEGRLFYHNEYKTVTIHNDIDSVALQVGLENWVRVYNNTGSTITNGTPVYVTGAIGETPTVAPADATTADKAFVIGVATHDIQDTATGVVTTFGLVSGIDTSALTAGTAIHLAPDGSIQNSAPTYPYFPTELGTCIVSDSADGYLFITVRHHTFERFRVINNQFIGGDLTVNGNLTINGTQSVVNQANLAVNTAFIYSNSGNTIGVDNTNFTGSGLNDAILTGHYHGTTTKSFYVRIDGVGTGTGGVDTFEWAYDSDFASPIATGVDLTTAAISLADNISVDFNATTGHTLNDRWYGSASPINVDAGFASNRNTGTSGVGYTHMGMFFDVTDEKWKLFKSYDPEPEGAIDTADSSYEKGTLDANITGNLTGNVTGDVTGTASNATALGGFTDAQFLRSDVADTKTAGDLSFSDGVKAIFGTDNDLQIYHDGANRIVSSTLLVQTNGFTVNNLANSENILTASANGAVTLYYDNAAKLATTSTGVDVTGKATAGRFTPTNSVSTSEVTFGVYASGAWVNSPSGTFGYLGTAGTGVLRWGASEVIVSGNVGVGTTSPAYTLDVVGLSGGNGEIGVSRTGGAALRAQAQASLATFGTSSNHNLQFITNNGSRMTITTAGNVGIGTTSPVAPLEVNGTARATAFRIADTGVMDDAFAVTTSTAQTAIGSWAASTYGGAKLIIEAKDGVNRHIVELLVTHNGTTAVATEYGAVTTNGTLATYDVDISGGNVRILATPASSNSTTFRVMRTTIYA